MRELCLKFKLWKSQALNKTILQKEYADITRLETKLTESRLCFSSLVYNFPPEAFSADIYAFYVTLRNPLGNESLTQGKYKMPNLFRHEPEI